MKKFMFIVFIFFSASVYGKNMSVDYGVRFGPLGELGIANVRLQETGNRYTIDIHANTIGIVKVMSGDRVERHISKGHIIGGKYISDSYEVFVSYKNKQKYKIYKIDHSAKTVTKHIIKKRDGKIVSDIEEKLPFYSENDLLTLYMNISKMISLSSNEARIYRFKAIGAENQNGTVEVIVPSVTQAKIYKQELGNGENMHFKAIINQPIFASKRGEILISMDKNGITDKAVLEDLLLFGDLTAFRK